MLRSLTIENYAIIRELNIEFQNGLNIITGQTGAGKSILLGALGMLSGAKVDASVLLDPETNCVVEGTFDIKSYGIQNFFVENDIDYADTITIRRVVAPTGKNRAFIEDQPVTQTQLKELSEKLIDIHSQHQSLLLSHEGFQTKIVDSVAGQIDKVEEYSKLFKSLRAKHKELTKLRTTLDESTKQRDFLQYQVEQIDDLKLSVGEVETLEEELQLLTHAADITEALGAAHTLADDSDQGYLSLIHRSLQSTSSVKKHYLPLEELYDRLNSAYIELKDLDAEFCDAIEKMEVDPARKEKVEQRLDAINAQFHKHNLTSEAELLALKETMEEQLWQLTQCDNRIDELADEIKVVETQTLATMGDLTKGRQKAIPTIEKHTITTMKALGIKDAVFTIELTPAEEMTQSGGDNIRFLFSANTVSAPQPIEKVASGGEISRLMLALKGLVSRSVNLPTIIFDEIDTGVSGAIADQMGGIISQMSQTMQVINITHLPQVASKGDHHYYVYKDKETHIKKLTAQERIERIAEMLSGANITDAARQQARQLLNIN